jgi:hypothetical protein
MSRSRRRVRPAAGALALGAALALAAAAGPGAGARGEGLAAGSAGAGAAPLAPSGLVYSSAPATVVQHQPAAGSCHARGSGLQQRPDSRCTPGAVNPAVTQATIASTICRSGWTATVRPPESVTEPEKRASLGAYGESGTSRFEYDHLVPLELGGAVNDPRNLWPEPDYPHREGFYLNPKDRVETALKHLVCDGRVTLASAQRQIARDWVAAAHRYGVQTATSNSA